MAKWMKATDYYNTHQDPLYGKRRAIAAEHGNSVRKHVLTLMPEDEIIAALGGTPEAAAKVTAKTGGFDVIRIRADLLGFIKALCIRYQHNEGKSIAAANVMSLVAKHGMEGVLELPIFKPVK